MNDAAATAEDGVPPTAIRPATVVNAGSVIVMPTTVTIATEEEKPDPETAASVRRSDLDIAGHDGGAYHLVSVPLQTWSRADLRHRDGLGALAARPVVSEEGLRQGWRSDPHRARTGSEDAAGSSSSPASRPPSSWRSRHRSTSNSMTARRRCCESTSSITRPERRSWTRSSSSRVRASAAAVFSSRARRLPRSTSLSSSRPETSR